MADEKKIYIEKVLNNGSGIGRIGPDGQRKQVVFVKRTIPGEIVSFKDESAKKNYIESDVDKVFVSSPSRRIPECPYFGKCGGCDFQHMDYKAQMTVKRDILADLFLKNARIEISPDIEFYPSPEYYYRNKISLRWSEKGYGLLSEGSYNVVQIDSCLIAHERLNRLIENINSIRFPEDAAGKIQLRVSAQQRSMAVIYSEADSAEEYMPLYSSVEADNVILLTRRGDSEVIKGKGYLTDMIDGRAFSYSHSNFMQVNNGAASAIYEFLSKITQRGGRMFDLYSGVGVHAILFSGLFKEVYSVEGSRSSVHYQRLNLKNNGIVNVKVVNSTIDDSFSIDPALKCSLIISDPPREGMSRLFLRNVMENLEGKFIYISCNPATLARDAGVISSSGFHLENAAIFDMFPQTRHFETVAIFSR